MSTSGLKMVAYIVGIYLFSFEKSSESNQENEKVKDGGAWWAARRLWGRTESDTTEAT